MATTAPVDRPGRASAARIPRLLIGRATFTDDVRCPGMLHAAVLRSPHPTRGSARSTTTAPARSTASSP